MTGFFWVRVSCEGRVFCAMRMTYYEALATAEKARLSLLDATVTPDNGGTDNA